MSNDTNYEILKSKQKNVLYVLLYDPKEKQNSTKTPFNVRIWIVKKKRTSPLEEGI
jgi:hypothetical protein